MIYRDASTLAVESLLHDRCQGLHRQ